MAALASTMVSKVLNQITPTGTSGAPGTFGTALGGSAMKVKLVTSASSGASSGTELTGTGYTAGGTAVPAASTASSAGSAVTVPATSALTWTNTSGGSWSIVGFELTDSAGTRVWFGTFTGQPIAVANGNTFRLDVAAISLSLT